MLRYSDLNCCLQSQHPIWTLIRALDAPLPIQLPTNSLEKAVEDGTTSGALAPIWETWVKLLALAWYSPG